MFRVVWLLAVHRSSTALAKANKSGASQKAAVDVRPCPHGRGVFSLREFLRRQVIQSFQDIDITTEPKSPPWKRWALIIGTTPTGKHLFWDEEPRGSPLYWANFLDHGDKPNVRFKIDMKQRTAKLVALRNIGRNEELLMNYRDCHPANWSPSKQPQTKDASGK